MSLTGLGDNLKKFERHSALRQKMFDVTGVQFGKGRVPQVAQEYIRSAMITCFQCNDEQDCKVWLESVEQGSTPPEFCQLRTVISQMIAFTRSSKI